MVTQPPPQQFCVRWNSYQSNLQNAFPKLLTSEHFVDVTLACENEMLKCHKVVLSACSTYFEKLLLQNPCQHPIIFMKDMKFNEMQSLVDFMYKGEVNVTQDDLPSLLKSAEALQIRGLCGSDQLLSQQTLNTLKGAAKSATNGPTPAAAAATANSHSAATATATEAKLAAQLQQLQQKLVAKHPPLLPKDNADNTAATAAMPKKTDTVDGNTAASSSDCDSNDGLVIKEDDIKSEYEDSYYDADGDLMDTEFTEEERTINTTASSIAGGGGGGGGIGGGGALIEDKSPDFAIANVSCQYDGSPSENSMLGSTNRRVRRSDEELRRAAECITRGQTFQTVSDQFNIPISTIRFYMARKGILPRRKRGRACSGTGMSPNLSAGGGGGGGGGFSSAPGNTSPIGPPYHIVHYKLPQLGVSKPI